MSLTRRQFVTAAAAFAISPALLPRIGFGQEKKSTRLVLLGTKGGPRVGEAGRSNPGTLISACLVRHPPIKRAYAYRFDARDRSIVISGDDASITDEQWSEGVRKHFKGRVVVGKDLMEI